jgi:hypothetical protein
VLVLAGQVTGFVVEPLQLAGGVDRLDQLRRVCLRLPAYSKSEKLI